MKKLNHYVIAEGEVTGHTHRVAVKDQPNCTLYQVDEDTKMIECDKEIIIEHETHKPVIIPAGKWYEGAIQEHDHFENIIRNVRD